MIFKIGIIGCGVIGHKHAQVFKELKEGEVVAFCDIDLNKAKEFSELYTNGKAEIFSDYKEMFQKTKIDIVYICLPPFAHQDEVEEASKRGIHIFIEKPICLDMKKAEKMVKSIEKYGVKSQVGFMNRFGEAVKKVKELIENGKAGNIGLMYGVYECNSLHVPWWRDKSKSGGQIVEQILHTYDIVRYFLGKPEEVYTYLDNVFHKEIKDYTSEDVSASIIRFKNGALAVVIGTNGAIPGKWLNFYEIVAKNITAKFSDCNHCSLWYTDREPPLEEKIEVEKDVYVEETLDLLNAIKENRETKVPIIEGAKTLEFVLKVREAGEKRKKLKF